MDYLVVQAKIFPSCSLMICGLMQLGGMELILEVVIIKRIVRNYTVVTFPYFEIITVLENW